MSSTIATSMFVDGLDHHLLLPVAVVVVDVVVEAIHSTLVKDSTLT